MKAIRKARTNYWNEESPSSKTDALRVIRTFERVNNMEFDPFSERHVDQVAGWGWAENRFRSINKALNYKGCR